MKPGLLICGLLLLIGACNPSAQSVTTTPTSRFATITGSITPRQLPPTWTPSPTATITPTHTVTPTPTLTPTPSEADICDGFKMLNQPSGRYVYGWDEYMPVLVMLNEPSALIRFRATHRQSGEGTGFEMPGGQTIGVSVFMNAMPRPGTYDWILSAHATAYGDICAITGSFFALQPTDPTLEATLTETPTPNSE